MKTLLVFTAVLFVQCTSFAGPISSGGGGNAVVFQGQAISAFMSDVATKLEVADLFVGINEAGQTVPETIKSVELISWAQGTSHYAITTSSGCRLLVDTLAIDTNSGVNFQTKWHPRTCN